MNLFEDVWKNSFIFHVKFCFINYYKKLLYAGEIVSFVIFICIWKMLKNWRMFLFSIFQNCGKYWFFFVPLSKIIAVKGSKMNKFGINFQFTEFPIHLYIYIYILTYLYIYIYAFIYAYILLYLCIQTCACRTVFFSHETCMMLIMWLRLILAIVWICYLFIGVSN